MMRDLKKVLLVVALLFGLVIVAGLYLFEFDERRLGAATNPCEQACLLDSGGVADCRKQCASHPTTYGPAASPRR